MLGGEHGKTDLFLRIGQIREEDVNRGFFISKHEIEPAVYIGEVKKNTQMRDRSGKVAFLTDETWESSTSRRLRRIVDAVGCKSLE